MRFTGVLFITAAVWACHGEDTAARRAEERLEKTQAEKAEKKKKSAQLDAERQKARKGEPALGAPWDEAKLLVPDGPCPKGSVADLQEDVFMVKLRGPGDIVVKLFDAAAAALPIEVKGSMECTGGAKRVTIAWTAPNPVVLTVPVASAAAAKQWADKHAATLLARVAFKLSRAEADGSVLRADLLGVRLSAGQDPAALAERK